MSILVPLCKCGNRSLLIKPKQKASDPLRAYCSNCQSSYRLFDNDPTLDLPMLEWGSL